MVNAPVAEGFGRDGETHSVRNPVTAEFLPTTQMTKQRGPTGRFAKAAPADTADPSVTFGRNRDAAEQTIAALQSVGRLEVIDSARVATFRTLADAVDADPVNASLWREYRAAEHTLREVTDDVDDELTQILGRLSTPLGDETDAGAPNPRAKGRRSS